MDDDIASKILTHKNKARALPLVGISVGDYQGIGLEIVLKAFDDSLLSLVTPVVFADISLGVYYDEMLATKAPLNAVDDLNQVMAEKINFLPPPTDAILKPIAGAGATTDSGRYAYDSLVAAVREVQKSTVDYMVTAPIDKSNIQGHSFDFPGHTEYLATQFKGDALMILCSADLRMGLVTGHIPIAQVARTVTPDLIRLKAHLMYKSLQQDFGIAAPKLAILGLNPHCGDSGVIGDEDDVVVRPTVEALQAEGLGVQGPFPVDGFFGSKTYLQFDGILAMYHDQGLAPFKALSFGKGVNFTAGLDKVRTSPDHGTAFGIAGKGVADAHSFRQAVLCGWEVVKNRRLPSF